MNGIDNTVTGAKQMWTGESENTMLHKGVVAGSKALGANDGTAENLANAADVSTIFLGGANSVKSIKTILNAKNLTNFEKIAMVGGEATKLKGGGIKVVREGGSKGAMQVYNQLLKSGYESKKLEKGYKLTKKGETILFRASKSGNYKNLDTFTKNINGKNVNIFFKK